ncbi:MAG: DUF2079 domain-containing protein [Chloroflexi bacterium]|nr:DUF2079 domain-containing protein [Chloroflexota bacterium]
MNSQSLRAALRNTWSHGLAVLFAGAGASLFWAVSSSLLERAQWWPTALVAILSGATLALGAWIITGLWLSRRGHDLTRALALDAWSYAIWLGPILFIPVYLMGGDHPALASWPRFYILLVSLLTWLGLKVVLFSERLGEWNAFLEQRGRACLIMLVGFYVTACMLLSWRKWTVFTLGNIDVATIWQSMGYTLRGEGFFYNTIEGVGHFGVHNSPALVLLLPIYAFWPDPRVILLLNPGLISLSAIPFFALARKRLGVSAALTLTVAYLLYPSVTYRAVSNFHEMTMLPLFLLLAFWAFEREHLGWFVVTLLYSLGVKESIALTAFVFAPYAFLRRRRWPWVVIPLLLSVASLWLSFAWVIPTELGQEVHRRANAVFGQFGETPGDVIRYMVYSPVDFARAVFTARKLGFVYQMLQPLGLVLPALSVVGLFALPALGLNLITQIGSVGVRAWESVIFGPLFYVATVDAITRASFVLRLPNRVAYLSLVVLGLTLACASYWLRVDEYQPAPYYTAQVNAVAIIPPRVSVSVPNYMTARFADRHYIQQPTGAPFFAEYHLVDIHWVRAQRGHELFLRAADDYEDVWANAQYGEVYRGLELVWREDGVAVYRRVGR